MGPLGLKAIRQTPLKGSKPKTRTPFFILTGAFLAGDWRNFRKGLRVDPSDELLGFADGSVWVYAWFVRFRILSKEPI